jgi:hypothetical protein
MWKAPVDGSAPAYSVAGGIGFRGRGKARVRSSGVAIAPSGRHCAELSVNGDAANLRQISISVKSMAYLHGSNPYRSAILQTAAWELNWAVRHEGVNIPLGCRGSARCSTSAVTRISRARIPDSPPARNLPSLLAPEALYGDRDQKADRSARIAVRRLCPTYRRGVLTWPRVPSWLHQ